MALATESNMEARIARLESDVGHIGSDLTEVKQDVRDLRARVDNLGERIDGRFDEARDRLDALDLRLSNRINAVERSLASAKVWALLLYITLAGAVYGTLARTMGWI
jgi:outer membrane murein-binding lipoprotein Lpp